MAKAGRYWEVETPKVVQLGNNEFRYYADAKKLQVYPILEGTAHGVGRGATIDLAVMDGTELKVLAGLFELATAPTEATA